MRAKVYTTGLACLVIGLATATAIMFKRARAYYEELNNVRLDPLGLGYYGGPPAAAPIAPIVFFGDSRAAEWPAPDGWSNVVNRGIGSQTTAQIAGRLEQDVLALHPSRVILQAGVNDLKTIPLFPHRAESITAQCKSNLALIVHRLSTHGIPVTLTTIFPTGPVPLERRWFWSTAVDEAIRDVNTHLMTLTNEFVTVFDASVVLGGSGGTLQRAYSRDLLHLTPEGYDALNRRLSREVAP